MKGRTGNGLAMALLAAVVSWQADAMTYGELQKAIRDAGSGGVVYVEGEVVYDGTVVLSKEVTLAGRDGRAVLRRAANFRDPPFAFEGSGALTLRDLALDGSKAAGLSCEYAVLLSSGQRLTLERGAEIRNFKGRTEYGLISIRGGTLEMREGAVIRDCENDGHGVAVALLAGGSGSVFNMSGGLITGCRGTPYAGSQPDEAYRDGWGNGTVYVEDVSSRFTMTGGAISGNASESGVAGVLVGSGYFQVGLAACVTNNVGGFANDVLLNAAGYFVVQNDLGAFTGRLTVHTDGEPVAGDTVPRDHYWTKTAAPSAAGLGGISCERHPEYVMDGRALVENRYPTWGYRVENMTQQSVGALDEMLKAAARGDVLKLYGERAFPNIEIADGQELTLVGAPGCRLLRGTDDQPLFAVANASLRLEDVTLDGGGEADAWKSVQMVTVGAGGTVTLGKGAVIENVKTAGAPAGVHVRGSGACLEMETGAAIRACRSVSADGYGLAVRVGDGQAADVRPRFRMTGGRIEGNTIESDGRADGGSVGVGGVVYLYNGDFEMAGGSISGNASALTPSGVNVWSGTCILSGTATIADNRPSKWPDLYRRADAAAAAELRGAFAGRIGVSSCPGSQDGETGIVGRPGETTGVCRIFNSLEDSGFAYGALSAYLYPATGKIYLYPAVAWVDGVGCPAWHADGRDYVQEDVAQLAPTAIDLDNAADFDALPHTFRGVGARAINGRLAVSVETAKWKGDPRLPLPLLKSVDGPFTGTWRFDLPEDPKGVWTVMKRGNGDGTESYALQWIPNGMLMVVW